ncbi:MAG: response regulator transcription factor [Gammaproteobacteria bacterium]|nr:response regulator transcription factor [Gammaproteobacteria bacterium]
MRESIKVALHRPDIKIIGESDQGNPALNQLNDLHPNVILMERNLVDINGKLLTEKLHQHFPTSRIIIFTAQLDLLSPLRCLDAGAVGYVTKQQPAAILIEAILTATTERPYLSPDLAQQIAANQLQKPALYEPLKKLSTREMDLLPYFAEGKKTREIADTLQVSPHTVNCHRHRILKKLTLQNETALAHLAIKLKLIEVPN